MIIQGVLEFVLNDPHYIIHDGHDHYYDLFGHGGMVFWFVSSVIFFIVYNFFSTLVIKIIIKTNQYNI